jgi:hypothetical protein
VVAAVEAMAGSRAATVLAAREFIKEHKLMPVGVFDQMTANAYNHQGGTHKTGTAPAPAPKPTVPPPDDPARLLHDLHDWLASYVAFPSAHAAVAVTLWAAHTHLAGCFDSTPRLALLSPERECGKTRVLELLELACTGAEMLSGASPAYLFRRIGSPDAGPVTLLLDEADAIWKRGKSDDTAEALRSIVNAGHRKGATVGRVEPNGKSFTLLRFPVYAPAALAGIDTLPDTILSRAVVLHMRRRAPGQQVRPFRQRTTRPQGEALADQLAAWAASVAGKVGDPWPDMPPGIEDRAADAWEPLLSVAALAGGDWPGLAQQACLALVKGALDDSQATGSRLLADIRDTWPQGSGTSGTCGTSLASPVPHVPHVPHRGTDALLHDLHGLDESPWGDWHGHPLNPRDLAKLLRPYDIRATKVRIGDLSVRGYCCSDFHDAWGRYLSIPSGSNLVPLSTSATSLARDVLDVADTPPRCKVCHQAMDAALTAAGYTTHPGCAPEDTPQPPLADGADTVPPP